MHEVVFDIGRSADAGDPEAMFQLAAMYERGLDELGVAQDLAAASRWYLSAAEHGHAGAMYNLGAMYESGRGVEQSYVQMIRWYRRAAVRGHQRAIHSLACAYQYGVGVPMDKVVAFAWFNLAASRLSSGLFRESSVRHRNLNADQFTAKELDRGLRLTEELFKAIPDADR